jgi:hypothetical protein
MNKISRMGLLIMVGMLAISPIFGQTKQVQQQRRPAANAPASDVAPYKAQDGSGASYILDGLPCCLNFITIRKWEQTSRWTFIGS